MPNQRDNDKSMLGLWLHEEFVSEIDRARGRDSRSQFARDAIAEKLARDHGVNLEPSKRNAPDRAGKGGRKPFKYPPLKRKKKGES